MKLAWAEYFPDDDAFEHVSMEPFLVNSEENHPCPCDPKIDTTNKMIFHECMDGNPNWQVVDE